MASLICCENVEKLAIDARVKVAFALAPDSDGSGQNVPVFELCEAK